MVTLDSNCIVSIKTDYDGSYMSFQYHAGYDTFITIEPYSWSFHYELRLFLMNIFSKSPGLGCWNKTISVYLKKVGPTFRASLH